MLSGIDKCHGIDLRHGRSAMISGVHAIIFSPAADAVRAFFRDTLGLPNVDAGDGWLIFALPPAELAVHPAEASRHAIHLLCDDLDATVATLEAKGVRLSGPISEQAWGRLTAIALPDGSEIALYQPTHPRPVGL
jgi:catechol 2,3-dioxygenase-like lactoylglutathione lyase family enzyme